jgi:hypothetical protein
MKKIKRSSHTLYLSTRLVDKLGELADTISSSPSKIIEACVVDIVDDKASRIKAFIESVDVDDSIEKISSRIYKGGD